MGYALIYMHDPARAAQYVGLVESHALSATPARTTEEALFHARRLGEAKLLVVEVRQSGDGFELLRALRKAKQTGPALVISGSWDVRNEALRQRKALGIAEVLAASQPLVTVEKALERTLGPRPRKSVAVLAAPSFPPEASAPVPSEGALETLLANAARSLRASMAVAWLEESRGGKLHGHFGWSSDVVDMVGTPEEWAPFRNLAASAPVDVRRAADDKVLSRSPLVMAGMVGSFAGAPLVDKAGEPAGVLWVAQREPDGLVPDVLHPLTVWAQHIGAALDEIAPAVRSIAPPPKSKEPRLRESPLDVDAALAGLLADAEGAVLISDSTDRIAFANPAAVRVLGLRNRRLTGLLRSRVLERLRLHSGLRSREAAVLGAPPADKPVRLEISLLIGAERVLSWKSRRLLVGDEECRVDEIADVTVEAHRLDQLANLARVDGLTLLGNLRAFEEALAREISRALRVKTPLAIAIFTIDRHDKLPAGVADTVLRDVAWLITDVSRGYDHAARVDGETIAVILPGAPAHAALRFAERMVDETGELYARHTPHVTLSGGIAQFDPGEDVGALVARARAAAREAEACGGNGVL